MRFAHTFTALLSAMTVFLTTISAASAASATDIPADPGLEQRLVDAVNGDRVPAGLQTLRVDPRLTEIARQRARYIIDRGVATDFNQFSHCADGGLNCTGATAHYVTLLAEAGFPDLDTGENLAINNDPIATAEFSTNTMWLGSPLHRANIMTPYFNATGIGVICCTSIRTPNGQIANNIRLVTQIFAHYSSDMLGSRDRGAAMASATMSGSCQYVLGFQSLHDVDPADTGSCRQNQVFAPNGDAEQETTGGLMAWRKADNLTAFTNGYWTWINGPSGLARRLNTERFFWEANPERLPTAS